MFSRTSLNKLLNDGHIHNITTFNLAKIVKIGVNILKTWAFEILNAVFSHRTTRSKALRLIRVFAAKRAIHTPHGYMCAWVV